MHSSATRVRIAIKQPTESNSRKQKCSHDPGELISICFPSRGKEDEGRMGVLWIMQHCDKGGGGGGGAAPAGSPVT